MTIDSPSSSTFEGIEGKDECVGVGGTEYAGRQISIVTEVLLRSCSRRLGMGMAVSMVVSLLRSREVSWLQLDSRSISPNEESVGAGDFLATLEEENRLDDT